MVLNPPYNYQSEGIVEEADGSDIQSTETISGVCDPEALADSTTPSSFDEPTTVEDVVSAYERVVVPRLINLGWGQEVAKSRSPPFYNNTDQSLVSHILPGIDILCDICRNSADVSVSDFNRLAALWTIHDIHKITDGQDEFDISTETVADWVDKLNLGSFAPSLDMADFKACAVALHNRSSQSKSGEVTGTFTSLRPYLRLADAARSVDEPADFADSAAIDVMEGFEQSSTSPTPCSHSIELGDSVFRSIANRSVMSALSARSYSPIDYRSDGALYIAPTPASITDGDQLLDDITDNFIENLRDSYQIFRNQTILGSDISSPQARVNNHLPRVYGISEVAKLCLSSEKIIGRIVQAAIRQQKYAASIPAESERKMELIENETDVRLPRSQRLDALAALVHTVFRKITPELLTDEGPIQTQIREAAVLHLFDASEETIERVMNLLDNESVPSSPAQWPHKYLIANELLSQYGDLAADEREAEIQDMLLSRLSEFERWDDFGMDPEHDLFKELKTIFATRVKVNGTYVHSVGERGKAMGLFNDIVGDSSTDKCGLCPNPTRASKMGPRFLSHRDYRVLHTDFITQSGDECTSVTPADKTPLCAVCQVSLSVRAQQLDLSNTTDEDINERNETLYVTVHPDASHSVGSVVRFQKVYNYLKTRIFSGEYTGLHRDDLASWYADEMSNELRRTSVRDAFVDRDRCYSVGTRFDAASSALSIPDSSDYSIFQGALAATVAALVSGTKIILTRQPQLHMSDGKFESMVQYGPGIRQLNSLVGEESGIEHLTERVELIDALISFMENLENPASVFALYKTVTRSPMLVGSQLFNQLSGELNRQTRETAAWDAVAVDALMARNTESGDSLLTAVQALGFHANRIHNNSDRLSVRATMQSVCDTIDTAKTDWSDDRLAAEIMDKIEGVINTSHESESVQVASDGLTFAKTVVKVFNDRFDADPAQFRAARTELCDAVALRALLEEESHKTNE